jgi:type II secretory pathway pseudopilin PulG
MARSSKGFPALIGTLATITFAAGLLGRIATGPAFWVFNSVALVSICASAVVPIIRNNRREAAQHDAEAQVVAARAALRLAINDALAPLANELANLASKQLAERRLLIERVLTLAVTVTAGLVDADRARSTLYRLDEDSPTWRLLPSNDAGRVDQAQTVFEEGTPAGDAVRRMIEGGDYRYCRDVTAAPPPGWVASPARAYRTFISMSVRVGGRGVGMLTVSAPDPDDLSEDDVASMRLISSLISTAIALTETRRANVSG